MTHKTCSSSSSSRRWKYDVFLNFYGKDTRKNFTDHLFAALNQEGIHTFRDDEGLKRGEDISSELMDAIEGSRIAIIVFSDNYASSRWCLSELVKILECKKNGQTVLPIFYKVDPSDVRHQKNTFAEALMSHDKQFKEKEKVELWKAALTEASNLSGWDQSNIANGHEARLIKIIVEKVSTIVKETYFHITKHPVGLDSQIERISCLLNNDLDVVRFIGIYGLPGIGKTTIVEAIFNDLFQKFEGSSFLTNVREDSRKHNGLVLLQKKLLSGALKKKEEDISIDHEDRGITIIKNRLCCKRVLIVLDDVDEMKQLDKLVGEHGWFGPGSQIIITTRDEQLLNRKKMNKYKVETMNLNESSQLFSLHAFGQNHPLKDYIQLSNDVVQYAGGLPLALVILGSLLGDKRSPVEWENELEKLRKVPNNDILKIFKISYDALDDFEQNIFLDISCFFIREDKDKAITILDACGLCPKVGIEVLIQRSFVTIDEKNKLCMHDLIRDMGREIVRKQSPRKLGGRSRLWQHTDALDVLRNHTGTDAVEGLQLDLSMREGERFRLTASTFSKMPNIRLLHIREHDCIDWELCHADQNSFFKNLVWVSWRGFPFEYIPNNFHLGNLVILDMQRFTHKEIWKGIKHLPELKVLDLSNSAYLTCTPDFSGLPKLEKLNLYGCCRLVEVDESIGDLSKLVELDLRFCRELRNLPPGIGKLKSLEKLEICHCYELEILPKRIGNLTRLNSILDLRDNLSLRRLPSTISQLSKLETLILRDCTSLKSLPLLPSSLLSLNAENCQSLKSFPNVSNLKHLKMMNLFLCQKLNEVKASSKGLEFVENIKLNGCFDLHNFVMQGMLQVISREFGNSTVTYIYLPGTKIRSQLRCQLRTCEASCQFALPNMEIEGMIICVLCVPFTIGTDSVVVEIHNQSKNFISNHKADVLQSRSEDPIWIIKIPNCVWKSIAEEYGDIINVSVKAGGLRAGIDLTVNLFDTLHRTVSYSWSSAPITGIQRQLPDSEEIDWTCHSDTHVRGWNYRSLPLADRPCIICWHPHIRAVHSDSCTVLNQQQSDVEESRIRHEGQNRFPDNCFCFPWLCSKIRG